LKRKQLEEYRKKQEEDRIRVEAEQNKRIKEQKKRDEEIRGEKIVELSPSPTGSRTEKQELLHDKMKSAMEREQARQREFRENFLKKMADKKNSPSTDRRDGDD